MNLRHLHTFVTVADAGGFARAGPRLNLSQSAASRQILALEAELGVSLFERIGRRIQLTSEGEDLLGRSRRLLADADALGERSRTLKGGQTGALRISAAPQVIENVLAPFLAHYMPRNPGVSVRLLEGGGSRQQDQLDRGEIHLALMPSGTERFHSRLLYPIHVLAVLPRTHRLGRHPVLDISQIADEPLLLLHHEFGSREWFDAACNVAHINSRVVLESSAPHTIVALAQAGYGIAIVPSNTQILRHAVRGVPLVHRGASVGRWSVVAWNPQRFLAPYAERFVEELVASIGRSYPGRDLTRRAPPLPRPKGPGAQRKIF